MVGFVCAKSVGKGACVSLERIEITPFSAIVGELLQDRRTGQLTIVRGPLRKVLYWSQGELVLISSSSTDDSLSDFLMRRNVIPADHAIQLVDSSGTEAVARFHESEIGRATCRERVR